MLCNSRRIAGLPSSTRRAATPRKFAAWSSTCFRPMNRLQAIPGIQHLLRMERSPALHQHLADFNPDRSWK